METTETTFALRAEAGLALEALGLPVNRDTIDQMAICARALRIYVEREEQYGGMWKQFDADDAAHQAVQKATRMRAILSKADGAAIDSALDVIIYAGFYVRHIEGNK